MAKKSSSKTVKKSIVVDPSLVAFCGLYCPACGMYVKGKCPGCAKNVKASWCKIRSCCIETKRKSCADCKEYAEINDCKKFNNIISRIIGFVLRSNRRECIMIIRDKGYKSYAKKMASEGKHTIKR